MSTPTSLSRPRSQPSCLRPRRAVVVAARFLAAIAIAAIAQRTALRATASHAQDNPPNLGLEWVEPVSGAALFLRSEPGSRCWRGACVDAGGTVTLAEPLTATLGTTATLLLLRNRDAPDRMTATWHPVMRSDGEAIDGLTTRWQALPPGRTVDLDPSGFATVTLPDEEGWWVLAVHARWGDATRSEVSWGVLLNVIDGTGEREFRGTYFRRFEASAFTTGEGTCYRDVGSARTWRLDATDRTGADGTGFYARYDAIQVEVSGAPWRSNAYDFVVVTVTFRGFVEPNGAIGASWARAGHRRNVLVTELLDMQPTLLCGGDKPDLLLADARVEADGCERGKSRENIRVTVRNVGSQPSDPYTVTATDTAGDTIASWTAERLAAGSAAHFETIRARRPADRDARGAVAESADRFSERFFESNNRRQFEYPATRPTACPPLPSAVAGTMLFLPLAVVRRR